MIKETATVYTQTVTHLHKVIYYKKWVKTSWPYSRLKVQKTERYNLYSWKNSFLKVLCLYFELVYFIHNN